MRLNYSDTVKPNSIKHDNLSRPFATVASAAVLVAGLAGCQRQEGYTEMKKVTLDKMPAATAIHEEYTEMKKVTLDKMPAATAIHEDEETSGVGCQRQKPDRLSVGDTAWFGATFRNMTRIDITGVTNDKVDVDILVPVGSPLPGVDIVTFTFKIKNNQLPKAEVEALFGSVCGPELADYSELSEGQTKNISKALEGIGRIVSKLGIRQIGEFVLTVNVPMLDLENTTVVEERDNEIVVEINGQRVTLDREVKMNLEYIMEKAGFFEIPLRLEVDGTTGGLRAVVDCSQQAKAKMEIFMSEHAEGEMNALPFCPQPK